MFVTALMISRLRGRAEDLRRDRYDGRTNTAAVLGQHGVMESDRDRWDTRYAESRLASAAPPDVISIWPEIDDMLPTSGPALDLACGTGAQSLWLVSRGLDVLSIDVSPRAIALLDEAVATLGVEDHIDTSVHDTDRGLPRDATGFTLIICQRYRVPDLYPELVERLAPGGVLCLTVLSAAGLDGDAGPFHAPAGELTRVFAPMTNVEIVRWSEGEGTASIVVRRSID